MIKNNKIKSNLWVMIPVYITIIFSIIAEYYYTNKFSVETIVILFGLVYIVSLVYIHIKSLLYFSNDKTVKKIFTNNRLNLIYYYIVFGFNLMYIYYVFDINAIIYLAVILEILALVKIIFIIITLKKNF